MNDIVKARTERTKWFLDARFGMFIHWGLYAIPARGEWVRSIERISNEDYEPYFEEFNPTRYNPREWARLAKEAGMQYAVLTAKHHDGFCLFDSALTDYKATNTPAGRDLVREFLDAFRAEGLKVGLYYSLLDWHHSDYPHYGDQNHPMRDDPAYENEHRDFNRYLEYMHGQVRELLTNYGHLDIMWFDFSYGEMAGEKWRATELIQMVRELQPWIIVDNRLEAGGESYGSIITDSPTFYSGDFASPEQMIPPKGMTDVHGEPIPWESCMTLNDHWGYCAGDRHYKNARMVIRNLVECVSKNGNLLLNVGPDAKGEIPEESAAILREVGRWMRKNGESVYGCGAANLSKPDWGRFTRKGNKLYAHVMEENVCAYLLDLLPDQVEKVRLLANGAEMALTQPWNTVSIKDKSFFTFWGQSFPLPDENDTVVELTLK